MSMISSSLTEESSSSCSDSDSNENIQHETTQHQLEALLHQEYVVKSVLAKHHGSTKNPEVVEAINKLVSMNPTTSQQEEHVASSPFLTGEFLCHTLPEFPGRIKNTTTNKKNSPSPSPHHHQQHPPPTPSPPGTVQYTLGRLSFGVFQPNHLVCTVRSVRQSIKVRASVKNSNNKTGGQQINNGSKFQTFDYPICLDLTIHTPSGYDLPAIMCHSGVCYKDPNNKSQQQHHHRLNVTFKGSTLLPSSQVRDDPHLLQVWQETFRDAYKNADKESGLWKKAIQMAISWWFQMILPTDDDVSQNEDYSVDFQMKSPPRGWLQVLYLSERLRITRGNRGTLVVVERLSTTTTTTTTTVSRTTPTVQQKDVSPF